MSEINEHLQNFKPIQFGFSLPSAEDFESRPWRAEELGARPSMKWSARPTVDHEKQTFQVDVVAEHAKMVTRYVGDLKDRAIRQALIELGWTPPND